MIRAIAFLLMICVGHQSAIAEEKIPKPYSLSLFGGWMTANDWQNSVRPDVVGFRDSRIAGAAFSGRLGKWFGDLEFELEGQAVRHLGDQDHWEFNLPLILRWQGMPYQHVIDSSLAFGIGPSYATQVPVVEAHRENGSAQWLVYWVAEIEAGPPDANWYGVLRLHHRSEAFGIVADSGGSNVLAAGLKLRF
jgi:hypothetical protein